MEKHSGEIKKIYDKTNEKFSKREMSLSECISFLSAPEYLMLRLHELELPHVLRIEPTNFCNLRCRMCPSPGVSNDRRGFMDIRLYEQILVEMKSRHPSRQYFIFLYLGGEPLMHKNICEMVDLAGSFGYITQINTNAMLLTAGLAERLIKTTLNYLYISFDDVTPAEYEHYRQGASYEKVGENIKTLLKIKKERGGENPLVTLAALRFPKEGDDDLNYAPRPSKELSNMFPGVSILVNWAHHWSSDFVSDVDGMPKIKPSTEYYPCPLLWRDMAIRWDGTVAACCYDLRGEHIIGKFPEQSLLDIWNGRAATALRQAHVMGRVNEIPLCRECSSLWVDRGLKEYFGEYAPFYLKKTL